MFRNNALRPCFNIRDFEVFLSRFCFKAGRPLFYCNKRAKRFRAFHGVILALAGDAVRTPGFFIVRARKLSREKPGQKRQKTTK